uniref:Uncharacterized protein n=1 Tax=Panagrellus redivivus TaxID=6233 RepID=A0A7E4ZW39_PANRE
MGRSDVSQKEQEKDFLMPARWAILHQCQPVRSADMMTMNQPGPIYPFATRVSDNMDPPLESDEGVDIIHANNASFLSTAAAVVVDRAFTFIVG